MTKEPKIERLVGLKGTPSRQWPEKLKLFSLEHPGRKSDIQIGETHCERRREQSRFPVLSLALRLTKTL